MTRKAKYEYAYTETKKLLSIYNVDIDNKNLYFCPKCEEPMIACQGKKNAWYFRHDNLSDDQKCEGMTYIHKIAQDYFLNNNNYAIDLRKLNYSKMMLHKDIPVNYIQETLYNFFDDEITKYKSIIETTLFKEIQNCVSFKIYRNKNSLNLNSILPKLEYPLYLNDKKHIMDIALNKFTYIEIAVTHQINESKQSSLNQLDDIILLEYDFSSIYRKYRKSIEQLDKHFNSKDKKYMDNLRKIQLEYKEKVEVKIRNCENCYVLNYSFVNIDKNFIGEMLSKYIETIKFLYKKQKFEQKLSNYFISYFNRHDLNLNFPPISYKHLISSMLIGHVLNEIKKKYSDDFLSHNNFSLDRWIIEYLSENEVYNLFLNYAMKHVRTVKNLSILDRYHFKINNLFVFEIADSNIRINRNLVLIKYNTLINHFFKNIETQEQFNALIDYNFDEIFRFKFSLNDVRNIINYEFEYNKHLIDFDKLHQYLTDKNNEKNSGETLYIQF